MDIGKGEVIDCLTLYYLLGIPKNPDFISTAALRKKFLADI